MAKFSNIESHPRWSIGINHDGNFIEHDHIIDLFEKLIQMHIGGHPPIPQAQNNFPCCHFSSNFLLFSGLKHMEIILGVNILPWEKIMMFQILME